VFQAVRNRRFAAATVSVGKPPLFFVSVSMDAPHLHSTVRLVLYPFRSSPLRSRITGLTPQNGHGFNSISLIPASS